MIVIIANFEYLFYSNENSLNLFWNKYEWMI